MSFPGLSPGCAGYPKKEKKRTEGEKGRFGTVWRSTIPTHDELAPFYLYTKQIYVGTIFAEI